jgi:hypothetical protein
MRPANKKTIVMLACFVMFTLFSGCTNWQKKYEALSVENENIKGLLERERSEKGLLSDKITRDQQTIDELRRQIEESQKTPAEAPGFGEGYDVAFRFRKN